MIRLIQIYNTQTNNNYSAMFKVWVGSIFQKLFSIGLLVLNLVFLNLEQLSATEAGEFEFEQGHWVGKSEWSVLGKFESCLVSLHNDENVLLILRLDRNYSLTVAVFEKHWRNSSEPIADVTAQADHKILYSGIGLLIESNTLSFEIEKPTQSIHLLGSS